MRNLIVLGLTLIIVWIFPGRWGATYFFPEMMAQYGTQVPWLMAWGALMMFVSMIIMAFLSSD